MIPNMYTDLLYFDKFYFGKKNKKIIIDFEITKLYGIISINSYFDDTTWKINKILIMQVSWPTN